MVYKNLSVCRLYVPDASVVHEADGCVIPLAGRDISVGDGIAQVALPQPVRGQLVQSFTDHFSVFCHVGTVHFNDFQNIFVLCNAVYKQMWFGVFDAGPIHGNLEVSVGVEVEVEEPDVL